MTIHKNQMININHLNNISYVTLTYTLTYTQQRT